MASAAKDRILADLVLLTTAEVADLWGVERHTIYKAVHDGRLKQAPIAGSGGMRFRPDDVSECIANAVEAEVRRRAMPPSPPTPAPLIQGSGRRRTPRPA